MENVKNSNFKIRKDYLGIIIKGIVLIILLMMAFTVSASAQSKALVRFQPSQITLSPGSKTLIEIRIDDAEDLFGYEIHLEFDPSSIQIVDSQPDSSGVQVNHGDVFDFEESFVVDNQVDNEEGTIVYAITQLASPEGISGDGKLLSLEVKGASPGASEFHFSSVILASTEGTSLPFKSEDGRVVVQGGNFESQNSTVAPTTQDEPTDNSVTDDSGAVAEEGVEKTKKGNWKLVAGVSGISIIGLISAIYLFVKRKK